MAYLDSAGLAKQVQYIKAYVNDRIDTNLDELGTAAYENVNSFAPAIHEHNHVTSSETANTANSLTTARAIDGVNFNGSTAIIHYGTCATAAGTAAKTVSCSGYTLTTGSRIIVKFTVTNTAANPTLNVNSCGAKAIQYKGTAVAASTLTANSTYEFVYDGTYYQLIGNVDTNTDTKVNVTLGATTKAYLLGTSTTPTSTATGTAAIADTNVYLTTTSGQLHATSIETGGNVVVGGTANTNYLQLPSGIKLF